MPRQGLPGPQGPLLEESLQILLSFPLDSHLHMTAPEANRVAGQPDRRFPAVTNSRLFLFKERVLAMGREDEKDSAKEDELKIGRAGEFSAGPGQTETPMLYFANSFSATACGSFPSGTIPLT